MIGINKRGQNIEEAWEMAKYLYTSAELAEQSFRETSMLTAFKTHWDLPFYDEPDPYCGGQAIGRMYIEQAPHIPFDSASPYISVASQSLSSVMISLRVYAERNGIYDVPTLEVEALRLLQAAQSSLEKLISRNLLINN